jgi:uracil-DNA glycosylase
MTELNNDWFDAISEEFRKPYYENLNTFIEKEYTTSTVFPNKENIFTAFNLTPLQEVKVVIIGQVLCS